MTIKTKKMAAGIVAGMVIAAGISSIVSLTSPKRELVAAYTDETVQDTEAVSELPESTEITGFTTGMEDADTESAVTETEATEESTDVPEETSETEVAADTEASSEKTVQATVSETESSSTDTETEECETESEKKNTSSTSSGSTKKSGTSSGKSSSGSSNSNSSSASSDSSDEADQGIIVPAGGNGKSVQLTCSSSLTGMNAELYDMLYSDVSDAAYGKRESTIFSYEVTFTYAELGVETYSEAQTAARAQMDVDVRLIFECLYFDCPFELYWYDKTGHMESGEIFAGHTTDSITIRCFWNLPVMSPYAGDNDYTIDTDTTSRALSALENAKAIAAKYKGKSDAEKLAGFAQEIMDLVEYESDYSSIGYTDIYNIVYVFDNDPDTNVVCNAYARAFQLLCSLTTFDNAACYYVTGYGTSGGGHAWNIVSIGGVNYLVDLTGTDHGTNGLLFALPSSYDGETYTFSTTNRKGVAGYCTYSYTPYEAMVALPESVLTLG